MATEAQQETGNTSINWTMPAGVIDDLRTYCIDEYGSDRHMGSVATVSMRHSLAGFDHDAHRTWERLQEAFGVQPYSKYYDIDTDSSAAFLGEREKLNISVSASVLAEYENRFVAQTGSKYGIGDALAEDIVRELRLRDQISTIHEKIDEQDDDEYSGEALNDLTFENKVEIDPETTNFSGLKTSPLYRLPVMAGIIRHREGEVHTIDDVKAISQHLGITTESRQESDYELLADKIRSAGETEPIKFTPGQQIANALEIEDVRDYLGVDQLNVPDSTLMECERGVVAKPHGEHIDDWCVMIRSLKTFERQLDNYKPDKEAYKGLEKASAKRKKEREKEQVVKSKRRLDTVVDDLYDYLDEEGLLRRESEFGEVVEDEFEEAFSDHC